MTTDFMYRFSMLPFLILGCFFAFENLAMAQPSHGTTPHFKKVLVVFYENQGYEATMSQPYFKSLSERGALLTNFYAETHPSQGNYIAAVAGDLHGVRGDENYDLDVKHLGDLLEAKGKTWKNYAEGFPGNCSKVAISGHYARKHVPFISFKNVQKNPARCSNIVSADQLMKDFANNELPDFSFYSPDQKSDGHDTGVAYADAALKRTFGPLLNNPDFMKDMLVVITFDEDDRQTGNRVYTSLIGSRVKAGASDNTRHSHYSLLRMIEDEFGLGSLNLNDKSAVPISGIWVP